MQVTISEMALSDVAEVSALTERLAFLNWNSRQFESELQSSCTYGLVARDENGAFAGYALFHLVADEVELLAIATVPEFTRQGIASMLYKNAVTTLRHEGGRTLFLEVREGNATARAFYERMGCTVCGKRKNYYHDGESAILYSAELAFI